MDTRSDLSHHGTSDWCLMCDCDAKPPYSGGVGCGSSICILFGPSASMHLLLAFMHVWMHVEGTPVNA